MTSTLAYGAGRRHGELPRPLRALAASPALILLLLGGLALRLTIAYVLFPSSGFETDISSYVSWALTLGQHGPAGFYANAGFSDYPPAYLYLLWPIGLLAGATADPAATAAGLVKLPPILLDLAVAWVLYRLVLGWTWPARRAEATALVAAALFLFNPVAFYDSALWGQTDAAGALVVLLGLAALIRGNSEGAAALAALAALVKPQFGIVLIPLVALVLLKRHLARPGSGPRQAPWAPRRLAAWLSRQQGWPRLLTSAAGALLCFFIVALPFGMGPLEYLDRMIGTAGGYSWISVNAFNAWSLIGAGGTPPLALSLQWSDDTVPLIGPIPAVAIGAALLTAGFLWGSVRGAVRDDRWTLLAAATFLAIAFFILPTRVHERYIFPALALMPILALGQGRWAVALVLLSAGAFINLHAILTISLYGTDNVTALPLGELFRSWPLIALSALLQTGVGLWAAWQLRPSLRTSPDAFDEAAATAYATGSLRGTAGAWNGPARTAGTVLSAGPGTGGADAEPFVRGPGTLDWVIGRLTRVPLRPDRSAALAGEGGGRIDRLDVLLLVVLIVAAATVRGFRLDQPASMYFDEVYHARTATEFLQHWEYGQPHDIYEFTHPHLAKYAMAWGIRLAGGNAVTGSTELGVGVRGAALERRWVDSGAAGARLGDRLYVGTGEELRVYDLATRDLIDAFPFAATELAVDDGGHRLFIADPAGDIFVLDTTALDARRAGSGEPGGLEAFAPGPGRAIEQLVATEASLIAIARGGTIAAYESETGESLGQRFLSGVTDAVELPWAERVVVDTATLASQADLSQALADALEEDAAAIEAELDTSGRSVVVEAWLSESERSAVQASIDDGSLSGVAIEGSPLLAVATVDGVEILDPWTLDTIEMLPTDEPATTLVLVERGLSEPTLYAAAGASLLIVGLPEDGPSLPARMPMPGAVRALAWNESAGLVHALGDAPEGGPTVYVVEPHGRSVFADAPLPEEPRWLLADTQTDRPSDDRGELLAISVDGSLAAVGIEQNAFGWRLPGMLLGVLGAALLYLLARVLFARRSVAIVAGVLVVAEGMLFANSRIAMNDVYVSTFVIAATLLVAPLFLAPRRPWTAVLALLGAGVSLGLALASKWVALYAIGGLLLLVLLRSGLGRVIALVGMVSLTAVLGAMAIRPAPIEDPSRNWTFLLLMLLLTGLLAAGMVRRPLGIGRGEVGLAVLGPILIGATLLALGATLPSLAGSSAPLAGSITSDRLLVAGSLAILVGVGALAAAWVMSRRRDGPAGRGVPTLDATTSGWLRPSWLAGLPWLFTLAALSIVPVGIYIVSYAPWVELGNQWGLPLVGSLPFLPDADAGQTLPELTRSMYEYHDDLRAEHAASSPWWAWPLDLKPVWFFQEQFAGPTTGLIYDTGNLVIFWLGLPAMAFTVWLAWRRRSPALAVVAIMWAALWLPWARIDRATFQYHVYASLPFLVLALSYFLAELWHGPSRRTWFLARIAAALAILAIPLAWLFRVPLCIAAGTAVAHPDGVACAAQVTRTAQISQAGTAALFVVVVGAALVALLGWRLSRTRGRRDEAGGWASTAALAALVVIAVGSVAGVLASFLLLDAERTTPLTLSSDVLALLGLAVLAIPARMVLRARDSRRFVLGVVALAVLWLLVWYPNISGLPLPAGAAHAYQGLLPTWNWDFQFAVNTDPAVDGGVLDLSTLVVGAMTLVFVVATAWAARAWSRAPDDRLDREARGPLPQPGRPT